MPFNQIHELSDLIWLGLPIDILQVDQFPYLRMSEDVVAAAYARESKSKSFREQANVTERDIFGACQNFCQDLSPF